MGYIYQADVYCNDCGAAVCARLAAPENVADESSYDSDDYPKVADLENEESDIPEHCAACGTFLQNPLTSEGYEYVKDALTTHPSAITFGWAEVYGFTRDASGKWSSDEMVTA